MNQFKNGDIVRINPDFITAFKNNLMPQFSQTEGWLPKFLHKYCTYDLYILSVCSAMGGNYTLKLFSYDFHEDNTIDFTPDGRLFSATSGPIMIIKKGSIIEEDPNFCSCGGETVHKELFSSTYPTCKACGKEKRQ